MRHLLLASSILLASALHAAPARSATLQEAIARVYSANPEIAAARAQLRQVDENIPIIEAGTRPRIGTQLNFIQDLSENFGDLGTTWRAGVALNQAIWEGGRIRANLSAATARIEAQRARLLATEYRVVVDTVTAYADVLRTQALVRLNEGQTKVLEQQLRASRDRFEVGDLTRTDVAQSEARLAAAQANLVSVRGQQVFAEQAYERLVGMPPNNLAPLPPLPAMPATAEDVRQQALGTNPSLVAAKLEEKARASDVLAVKRDRLPTVGAEIAGAYTRATGPFFGISGFNPRIGVSASMPLFTSGLLAARVRQAQAQQSEQLEQVTQTERLVTEAAVSNHMLLRTAEAVISSARVQIDANALATEGVRQENQVGSRDILDVLNAEQELLNARVQLVQAERERYVATYQLLETIGVLEPVLEAVAVGRYDAAANAARVRSKRWGEFSYDPDPRTDRTRNTVPLAEPLMGPQQ